MSAFPPIRPAPAVDDRTIVFTAAQLGTATISSVAWTCEVSSYSSGVDPTADQRISNPTVTPTTATVRFGGGVDGVTYLLTAAATLTDGRVLVQDGLLLCTTAEDPVPDALPLTVDEFRETFPAFGSTDKYPDAQVSYWIGQAARNSPVNVNRAGQFYGMMLRLWVAHNLVLEQAAQARGAVLGSGVPASKSVGPVSVSYDVQFGSETNGGSWNLTMYGQRFLRYLRMIGSAPVQL